MTKELTSPSNIDPIRRTQHFRALYAEALVLPNACDAASACIIENAGAAAVATTSAGISWVAGVPDGENLSWACMRERVAEIVAAVQVPVTVDIEGGYGDVARVVGDVVEMGASGVNVEDSSGGELLTVGTAAALLRIARRAADASGYPLFINARIDAFLLASSDSVDEVIARAKAYLAAGADTRCPGHRHDPSAGCADSRSVERHDRCRKSCGERACGGGCPTRIGRHVPRASSVGARRATSARAAPHRRWNR